MYGQGGELWGREGLSIGKVAQHWWKRDPTYVTMSSVRIVRVFKVVSLRLLLVVCNWFLAYSI